MRSSPDWVCRTSFRVSLIGENAVPLKLEFPVKGSPHKWRGQVLQAYAVNDVDDRGHNSSRVLRDGSQQGLQPDSVDLTVAVQEHQDFAWGGKNRLTSVLGDGMGSRLHVLHVW